MNLSTSPTSAPPEAGKGQQVDPRQAYTAGLRILADLLDANPDLPLPSRRRVDWSVVAEPNTPGTLARIAKILPTTFTKNDPTKSEYNSTYYTLDGQLAGLEVQIWALRSEVCHKKVTVKTVTERLPATPAVEAEPERTVTRDVEHVEWVCTPILAEVSR